jgi:HIRAN domain
MATQKRQVSIVGSSFHPGAGNWLTRLKPRQQLRVEREPRNKYDTNAVSVWIFHQCLGYFPRGFAAEVAPLMDAGYKLSAWKSSDPRFATSGVMVVEWETPDVEAGANEGPDQ